MAGTKCYISFSQGGKSTLTSLSSCKNNISVYGKGTTLCVPTSLSSCKKNSKSSLRVARATLAMDFLEAEEVKVDVSSILKVTATVTVKISNDVSLVKIPWPYPQNDMEPVEKGVRFQLVSTELDPSTKKPKVSKECVKDWSKCPTRKAIGGTGCLSFEVELVMDADFGEPGAILVGNNYEKELYVETISLDGFVHFSCKSWVQPAHISKEKRIFFSNKVHIASFT
ncbi:putative linoleate 13S-lipoxygenase [Helianthus debilis subsp. tardiflorus]